MGALLLALAKSINYCLKSVIENVDRALLPLA